MELDRSHTPVSGKVILALVILTLPQTGDYRKDMLKHSI